MGAPNIEDSDGYSWQQYACAIGEAVLSFNAMEEELHGLLLQLLEREDGEIYKDMLWFKAKLDLLCKLAAATTSPARRHKLEWLITELSRIHVERDAFAHSILWLNPFANLYMRRGVLTKKGMPPEVRHDARSPDQIRAVARDFWAIGEEIAGIAARLRFGTL